MDRFFKKVNQKVNLRQSPPLTACLHPLRPHPPGNCYFKGQIFLKTHPKSAKGNYEQLKSRFDLKDQGLHCSPADYSKVELQFNIPVNSILVIFRCWLQIFDF